MENHGCGICGQSFPSGRSLAGHKRSHVALSSSMAAEEKQCSRYCLRDNPTKSRRLNDPSPEAKKKKKEKVVLDDLKQEMEEANKVEDGLWSRGCYEEEGDEMQSQSASEVTAINIPVRKQRSRSRRIPASSSSSSPTNYDKKQVDVALCLLMLSRGGAPVTESSEKTSKIHTFPSESGSSPDDIRLRDQEFKGPKTSIFSSNSDLGDCSSAKKSSPNRHEFQSPIHSSSKRNEYKCKICDKSFHSYQALGGHRASHNKAKGGRNDPVNQNAGRNLAGRSSENPGGHECPICGKVFGSGQALGGHKRSHVVSYAYRPAQIQIERKISRLNSIDLNLPAAEEDC